METNSSIKLKTTRELVVNKLCSVVFTYTVGTEEWKPGGRLYICDRHFADWSSPQFTAPTVEGYTSVTTSGSAGFTAGYQLWHNMLWHPWQHITELTLVDGEPKPGDTITVTYGDQSLGSPGIRVQSFVEPGFRFRVFIDHSGTGDFEELIDPSLSAPIVSAPFHRMEVVCPSQPINGESGRIQIRGLDQYGNTAPLPSGNMLLLIDDRISVPVTETGRERGWINLALSSEVDQVVKEKGIVRVHVHHKETAFECISNPITCAPNSEDLLLWGEVHAQSYVCDGTRTPADLLRFAREEGRLDFASVTSHDCVMHNAEEDYRMLVDAANCADTPGEFVALVGMEWSGITARGGDHNIYFRGSNGRFFNSGHIINQVRDGWREAYDRSTLPPWNEPWMHEVTPHSDLRAVYAELDPDEAMIIPHGGGRITNLDYHHPLLEPAIEMFSCHETYEPLAHEALLRGYRMAFIGGSDDHRGALGDSHPTWRVQQCRFTEHNGYAAAYAPSCTRDGIWKAFKRKSVYATTGVRIILDFHLNGTRMGSSVMGENTTPRNISIKVHGTNHIRQVELWRNTQLLHVWPGRRMDCELQHTDSQPLSEVTWPATTLWGKPVAPVTQAFGIPIKRAEAAYFVRVVQVDGHMAWSSPVWVDVA